MFELKNAKVGNVVGIDLDNDGEYDEEGYILRVNGNYADVAFFEFDNVTFRMEEENSEKFWKLSESISKWVSDNMAYDDYEELMEEEMEMRREREYYAKRTERACLSQAF